MGFLQNDGLPLLGGLDDRDALARLAAAQNEVFELHGAGFNGEDRIVAAHVDAFQSDGFFVVPAVIEGES